MEEASSIGSIIEETYVLTPVIVDIKMLVRPTEEMKLAVPRPVTVLVSSVGSIMDEILLLVPVTVLVRFASVRGCCPLMLDTMSCGAETVPEAVKRPVLIWRVEWDVVIMSPMLMKPLLEPMAKESTTREEIYACVAVMNALEILEVPIWRLKPRVEERKAAVET
jgi:hypothetical protein